MDRLILKANLVNCWWQKSDIWSQASYRYTILWVAFLDPSDSYFLFVNLVGFYTHWTYIHIFLSNYWWQKSVSAINSCWEKWAYMFNVYKNQQNRQIGSRNLMGPTMLPTIWTGVSYVSISSQFILLLASLLTSHAVVLENKVENVSANMRPRRTSWIWNHSEKKWYFFMAI
jgi:hypothetical protein